MWVVRYQFKASTVSADSTAVDAGECQRHTADRHEVVARGIGRCTSVATHLFSESGGLLGTLLITVTWRRGRGYLVVVTWRKWADGGCLLVAVKWKNGVVGWIAHLYDVALPGVHWVGTGRRLGKGLVLAVVRFVDAIHDIDWGYSLGRDG